MLLDRETETVAAIAGALAEHHAFDVPEVARGQWTEAMKGAFKMQSARGLQAVYMIATRCPKSGADHALTGEVLSRWGGSKGVRLAAIGITTAVPWTAQFQAPFAKGPVDVALYWRLWVHGDAAATSLMTLLRDMLDGMKIGNGQNGYIALSHDTLPIDVRNALQLMADVELIKCRTDTDLRWACEDLAARADGAAIRRAGRR